MASELCMNCFSVKGQFEVCPYCGYVEGTPPAQPHCLTPGTILGKHFIVGTVIGFGGFGITYKCFDTTLGITVAAKEFYPMGLVNRSPGESRVGLLSGEKREQYREQLKRFVMEAQSVAQFGKAKDIVNVYDFFEENGTAYMIMEYIDGILLKDYLEKQGPMPPDVAMSVIMPIIEAVKKIHSKGIIHRDISPDNIFITDEKSIKIFDFGAAQLNRSKEGMAGEKVIKVGYSAPEQYRDNSKQDFYTDIYSVGAIMYQLLTGRKPIESTSREYKDKLKSPLELGIKVTSNVDKAVMEAMAVKPELRYQGIQQFEDALRNKRVAEYPKDKIKKQKRKRNWIIASALTLTLAIGVAIFLAVNGISGDNEAIFDTYVANGTAIKVWVENEDQLAQLEDLKDHGFTNKGSTISLEGMNKADRNKWSDFWSENEGVDVEIEVVDDIEKKLSETPTDQLPNMYITDHVSAEQKEKTELVSLEEVYESLSNVGSDYDMGTYRDQFPDYKEMPTGVDTLLLYKCSIDYNKDNTIPEGDSPIETKTVDEADVVELNDLMSSESNTPYFENDGALLTNKLATFDEASIAAAAYMMDVDGWKTFFDKTEGFRPRLDDIENIQNFNQAAMHTAYALNSDSSVKTVSEDEAVSEALVYGSNIVAGTAFRKKLDDAIKNTSGVKNPVARYDTCVVMHNDNMVLIYSERYGITGASDSSQINACKRLLYMMMDSIGQQKKIANSSATTLPIRKDQQGKFEEIRKNMSSFTKLRSARYKNVEVIGNMTGNMYQFTGLISGQTDKKRLEEICSEYAKSGSSADQSGDNGSDEKSEDSEEPEKEEGSEGTDESEATEETGSAGDAVADDDSKVEETPSEIDTSDTGQGRVRNSVRDMFENVE